MPADAGWLAKATAEVAPTAVPTPPTALHPTS